MKKILSLQAALILCCSGPGFAEATATLDEVVVTATKTTEKTKDVANTVIIKDALDLDDAPALGYGELLANEPGLDWRTYGNYGGAAQEIHIRGMGGEATQVFLNGINLNSPSLGSADFGRLPTNSVEKVEVVKGSGSLLYGTGAMGGTINLLSKNPRRDEPTFKATVGYGTEDTYELAAEQGMFITDNLGYYLTATTRETDGFRDNSDLEHYDLTGRILFDLPEKMQISFFSAYIDREYGVPGVKPPEGTATYLVNGTALYNDEAASLVNEGEDEDWHNVLEFKAGPRDDLTLTLRAEYSDTQGYHYQRYNYDASGQETWITNTSSGIESYVEWHPLERLTLLVGGQYRDIDNENKQVDLDDFSSRVPGSRSKITSGVYTRGGYIEAQYRAGDYLKMLAGMRYEHHSTAGSEAVPRFGLVINPLENTVIKLNHGKHFRSPTINDLFWPDTGFTKGNTNLVAETGWHSEATIEHVWQEKIMVSLTWFQADIDDKIAWAEDPADPNIINWGGYWKPSNVNKFESEGLEAGLTITPVDSLRVALSYTYLDAREEKAPGAWRQATNTAKNTFKAELGYLFSCGLHADLVVRYVDERPSAYATNGDTAAEHVLDSYWTTDVKISQNIGDHWRLALTAVNLFDKGFDTNSGDFYGAGLNVANCDYPGATSSFFATASYEF